VAVQLVRVGGLTAQVTEHLQGNRPCRWPQIRSAAATAAGGRPGNSSRTVPTSFGSKSDHSNRLSPYTDWAWGQAPAARPVRPAQIRCSASGAAPPCGAWYPGTASP
jgi:hypothetical protein